MKLLAEDLERFGLPSRPYSGHRRWSSGSDGPTSAAGKPGVPFAERGQRFRFRYAQNQVHFTFYFWVFPAYFYISLQSLLYFLTHLSAFFILVDYSCSYWHIHPHYLEKRRANRLIKNTSKNGARIAFRIFISFKRKNVAFVNDRYNL